MNFYDVDWKTVLVPSVAISEIFLRGTVVYLFILFLMRLQRREAGVVGIADMLVIVLVADAAQNAMSAEYKSITEGMVLVGTIFFWDYLFDWLGFRFPKFNRVLESPPLLLIKDGQLLRKNMRREMITFNELTGLIREKGVSSPGEVKECYLESDGNISIIKKDTKNAKAEQQSQQDKEIPP